MNIEIAKNHAFEARIWLTKNKQKIASLLNLSGVTKIDLDQRFKDPEFLSFLLDFVMASDDLVLCLIKDLNTLPEEIKKSKSVLSGGDLPHWT